MSPIAFYLCLLAVNFVCFLPVYLLNFREQPNPFAYLMDKRFFNKRKLKFFYAKHRFSDPFKINFDFTVVILLGTFLGVTSRWFVVISGLILAVGFLEVLYTSIMRYVFKRAPAIVSDISLAKSGLSIAKGNMALILVAAFLIVVAVFYSSHVITAYLVEIAPHRYLASALIAALLIPPCFYHWHSYNYSDFLSRTVYSPSLHFFRNIQFSNRFRPILSQDASYFEKRNQFKAVRLKSKPNVVTICIESYGNVVFRDPSIHSSLKDLFETFKRRLNSLNYGVASNVSKAPLFAGGSWLSYASFTYGIKLDDLRLYDGLFVQGDAFSSYESLFHVLKRNGYKSFLLCPLGGVDKRDINWDSINRCFQSDENFDFDSLNFGGRRLCYFAQNDTYSAPDEYALNYAYEQSKNVTSGPFSLFFCTLNSHIPWESPICSVADWRKLNDPDFRYATTMDQDSDFKSRYVMAIRYQLDFILNFVVNNADDDLVVTLFGDHQPPLIAMEDMGRETPVHIISRNHAVINEFLENGFVPELDLTKKTPRGMRHEGYLSLFLKSVNAAYGHDKNLDIVYRESGVPLFDE